MERESVRRTKTRQKKSDKSRTPRNDDAAQKKRDREFQRAVKALAAMDRFYQDRRAKYQAFVEENRKRPTLERALAWLRFVASDPEGYGDLEALVYLRSQGVDVSELIDETIESWKAAEKRRIAESTRPVPVIHLPGGRTTYRRGTPRSEVEDIENASEYVLPPFWQGHRTQMFSIDATMLRAVEWCEIGGFDPWWKRLARTIEENAITGIEPESAIHYLFNMARSSLAITLARRGLVRFLEAAELKRGGKAPWITSRPVARRGRNSPEWLASEDNDYAAALVFSAYRLRGGETQDKATDAAVAMLQRNQRSDGSWAARESEKNGDIEVTAACIHALSIARPRGWEREVKRAAVWLQGRQNEGGHWVEEASPDPVYLTVLVMDAFALASGGQNVTFRTPEEKPIKKGAASRRYQVAVSFPGEIRAFVESTVRHLQERLGKDAVFYDRDHQAELAAPDLDLTLQAIYRDNSELIVVFLVPGYLVKEWCGLEWRAIRELMKTGRGGDIMFLRSKDASLPPGMLSIDGYVDITSKSEIDVVHLIEQRLKIRR